MAGRTDISEVSSADHADDRDIRNIYKAVLADGQAVCKHPCRSCDDIGSGVGDIHYREAGSRDQWCDDRRDNAFRSFHGLSGAACRFYSGICVHHVVLSVHRFVPTD